MTVSPLLKRGVKAALLSLPGSTLLAVRSGGYKNFRIIPRLLPHRYLAGALVYVREDEPPSTVIFGFTTILRATWYAFLGGCMLCAESFRHRLQRL